MFYYVICCLMINNKIIDCIEIIIKWSTLFFKSNYLQFEHIEIEE